jgi:hypothetical protein
MMEQLENIASTLEKRLKKIYFRQNGYSKNKI